MKIHALKPSRAACAATEFARLPVEEQANRIKAKMASIGERHCDYTILEAQGRQADCIVLEIEIAQANALSELRRAEPAE